MQRKAAILKKVRRIKPCKFKSDSTPGQLNHLERERGEETSDAVCDFLGFCRINEIRNILGKYSHLEKRTLPC